MKKKVHKETEMVKAVKELESGMSADVVAHYTVRKVDAVC